MTTDRPASRARFTGSATAMFMLAALTVIGGAIVGILLITHSAQACTPNPYNDAFGTDLADCHGTHPWVGAGLGVIAGDLVTAAILVTVGRLCGAVDALHANQAAAST